MEYIGGPLSAGCFLCEHPRAGRDREHGIVARRAKVFAVLNRYPYNNGHLLVAPWRHVASLEALDREERLGVMDLCAEALEVMREAMRPEGFNVGVNLGRTAGAGLADHVHVHVVPRWDGDTNFMPVTGLTKVIGQHLLESFDALAPRFAGRG
jgi:ATP adenylyltransferase